MRTRDQVEVHLGYWDNPRAIICRYNPPPSLWEFHGRTPEELEGELHEIAAKYINYRNTKSVQTYIVAELKKPYPTLD